MSKESSHKPSREGQASGYDIVRSTRQGLRKACKERDKQQQIEPPMPNTLTTL